MALFSTTLTNGADTLVFTGKDLYDIPWTIDALAGDDNVTINAGTITSGGGDFTIANMGDGDDVVRVNGGFSVVVHGENGNDRVDLFSSAFFDGGPGNDTLNVSGGAHANMNGGPGADTVNFNADIAANIEGADGDDLFNGNDHVVSGSLSGGAGNDTFFNIRAPSGTSLTFTGGPGSDFFRGTVAQMNGVTIADFSPGDMLMLTGVDFDLFGFSLSGGILTYNGGSLTFGAPLNGTLSAGAFGMGRVILKLTGSEIEHDAASDFDGDGRSDILWRSNSGGLVEWLGEADGSFTGNPGVSGQLPIDWFITGIGDFNGDGHDDLLWRNDTGALVSWLGAAGGGFVSNPSVSGQIPANWFVTGTGDFNGDGNDDILWRNDAGAFVSWLGQPSGGFISNPAGSGEVPTEWFVTGTGDYDGDGRDDILWRSGTGALVSWHGQSDGTFANNPSGAGQLEFAWQVQPNPTGIGYWD